jgi:NADH-quinone oxidoreductase subunit A
MPNQYLPAVFLAVLAALFAVGVIFLSHILGRRAAGKGPATFLGPYECGVPPAGDSKGPIPVRFFLVALVFLLFDVEVALLFPWAALFKTLAGEGMGGFILLEGAIFIGLLSLGLVYIFRRGALKW